MNQNYAKKGRFFSDSEGVREAAEAVSHTDMAMFFAKYVARNGRDSRGMISSAALGLRATQETNDVPDAGFIASRNFDGPMLVGAVTAGSDAERVGLQMGDTILEISGKSVGQESSEEMARFDPGDTITLKVRSRRGGDRELKWKVGSREQTSYKITDLENVTAEQQARRAAWLKGEAQIPQQARPH